MLIGRPCTALGSCPRFTVRGAARRKERSTPLSRSVSSTAKACSPRPLVSTVESHLLAYTWERLAEQPHDRVYQVTQRRVPRAGLDEYFHTRNQVPNNRQLGRHSRILVTTKCNVPFERSSRQSRSLLIGKTRVGQPTGRPVQWWPDRLQAAWCFRPCPAMYAWRGLSQNSI